MREEVKRCYDQGQPDSDAFHLLEFINPPGLDLLLENIRPRIELEGLYVSESLGGVVHPSVLSFHNFFLLLL